MWVVKSSVQLRIIFVCLALFVLAFFLYRHPTIVGYAQEDITYVFDPSADRAFSYGVRHFDALVPQEYDIERARYFFQLTLKNDPEYPLAHHQLGRIAFLGGNFALALNLLDTELADNPKPSPASYYVRALIKGYIEDYAGAVKDYEAYFKVRPATWAGINDYSWVLLKANLPEGAHEALSWGLKQWPENAWLLANDATALYELGRYDEAAVVAKKAIPAVNALSIGDWLNAYPGNDPLIAQSGLDAFKKATEENLAKILEKTKTK